MTTWLGRQLNGAPNAELSRSCPIVFFRVPRDCRRGAFMQPVYLPPATQLNSPPTPARA